ncbi:MAG: hypothetical protein J6W89_06155, partial [Paludibacteraceae bacterium]|nr:hypothetical protein [Paludibacteraceae bacterium]
TYSPRFKKDLPLLMNVPGRTGIRIHTDNKPEHSQGCILVGATGKKMIEELIRLNASFNEKTFIRITDACGSEPDTAWEPVGQEVTPWHPQLALPPHFGAGSSGSGDLPE